MPGFVIAVLPEKHFRILSAVSPTPLEYVPFAILSYLIFVNFGSPPHFFGPKKYINKCSYSPKNSQNRVVYAKKYTTAGAGSDDY